MQLICQLLIAFIVLWNAIICTAREETERAKAVCFAICVALGAVFYGAGSFSLLVK